MPPIVADTADPASFAMLSGGPGVSPDPGLLPVPKLQTPPPVDPPTVEQIISQTFAFPSADLVHQAAELFPVAYRGSAVVSWDRVYQGADLSKWHTDREGPVSVLSIAPGMVKLSRFDPARRERALANQATGEVYATRGVVCDWSKKSQARMMIAIRQLDLNGYIVGRVPVMVTLTLPGDWLAVAPDAATASAAFRRFKEAYRYRWGKVSWLWKREFQRRGAPHWHLWLVPPTEDLAPFREWLSLAWTSAIRPARCVVGPCAEFCVSSEWCRSLSAGTGVDRAAALAARDPQRLAVYFLKESGGGDAKAYQNSVPWEWCVGGLAAGEHGPFPQKKVPRASVGRFWGATGLEKVVSSVELDESVSWKLWRAMAAARVKGMRLDQKPMTRVLRGQRLDPDGEFRGGRYVECREDYGVDGKIVQLAGPDGRPSVRVIRSRPTVTECAPVVEWEKMDDLNGEPWLISDRAHVGVRDTWARRRPVNRRVKSQQNAGWVGVNDGPGYAAQLARYARMLAGDSSTMRDSLPPLLAHLTPGALSAQKQMRLRALREKNLRVVVPVPADRLF